jgi:gluconolactonase
MWNISGTPPQIIEARVLTRVPQEFRKRGRTEWSDANKPGHEVDCFLEGPSFDREGNLYVVDIPFGRVFRITPALEWSLVTQYDGWPNGLAIHKDGSIWIADYRKGLLRLPRDGNVEPLLGHRNSESFKGLNDLTFDHLGNCYFTDQGQTGLHDPTGRVYRYNTNGRLDLMVTGIPSPNGIALDTAQKVLFIAVTRANAVWRGPILPDGNVSKVGALRTFFGTSGPDGMAVDRENGIVVAHASLGGAFVIDARGEVTHFIRSPEGSTVTNVAYRAVTSRLLLTVSESCTTLEAGLAKTGDGVFYHSLNIQR